MSNMDQSLDDLIKKDNRRGGRAPATRGRATARATRQLSKPYQPVVRGDRQERSTRRAPNRNEQVGDTMKVSSTTVPNKLAGAICNVVREGGGALPGLMATGPQSINQAIKGLAIARKYLNEESIDLVVSPRFEEDIRSGSNVCFELASSKQIVGREPTEDDLSAKDKTDCFKLAGAIAGRIRDGEQVAVTTKGAVPVLVAVKAIALAQDYVADENIEIKFAVQFRDLEDPELRNMPSTYLHFALLTSN